MSRNKLLNRFGILANGFVIWEGPSPSTGDPLVAIITGVRRASKNDKTGEMLQLWILRADLPPHEAFQTGQDRATCGTCIHSGNREGTCYVRTFDAPLSVYRTFHRGSYPRLDLGDATDLLQALDRPIRLGAYGDPAMLPFDIVSSIAGACPAHTGYTHQFREPWFDQRFLSLVMASLDGDQTTPKGARSFRVIGAASDTRRGEILCPASEEAGKQTTCAKCRLCAGSSKQAKNVAIVAHGKASRKLLKVLQVV